MNAWPAEGVNAARNEMSVVNGEVTANPAWRDLSRCFFACSSIRNRAAPLRYAIVN